MDGKTGSAIVGHWIKDQPGEGVVALQHVSETDKVTNEAFAHGEYFKIRSRKILMADLSCLT